MRLKLVLSFMFLFTAFSVIAQNTGNLIGHVQDQNTSAHLEEVHIFAEGTTLDTYSDSSGDFILELPVGTYTIVAFLDGYGEKVFLSYTYKSRILVPINTGYYEI